jgi:hypothetical protein
MSADALPLTLLIVLTEAAVGGVWLLLVPQVRNNAVASFIKFSAALVFVVAALAFFVSATVEVDSDLDGYPLRDGWMTEFRLALAAVFALSGLYAYATVRDHRGPALALGGAASIAGLAALALFAQVVSAPTWGYPLVLASLIVGALAVGAVSHGMTLGHWYLVTPRLPEQPLRELTGLLVLFIGAQAVLLGLSLALPRDDVQTSVDEPILENYFLWLRAGLGLAFPGLLAWMAWDSAGVRGMQSATGLLYIAMVLVICGEIVGKGLLFASAVPN